MVWGGGGLLFRRLGGCVHFCFLTAAPLQGPLAPDPGLKAQKQPFAELGRQRDRPSLLPASLGALLSLSPHSCLAIPSPTTWRPIHPWVSGKAAARFLLGGQAFPCRRLELSRVCRGPGAQLTA